MMKSVNVSLNDIFDDLNDESRKKILEYLDDRLTQLELKDYNKKLKKLFEFTLETDPSLFTNIKVKDASNEDKCKEYICKWCDKYINDRETPSIKKKLKAYGERDEALDIRIKTSTQKKCEIINEYWRGHVLYMSAENMNGAILEEYLASVLEEYGWLWCAGSTLRAVDFCKPGNPYILLQVKNKYNTENSSSSAIRKGTEIQKWHRLGRAAQGGDGKPVPNWEALVKIVDPDQVNQVLDNKLTEEKYIQFIKENTLSEIDEGNNGES